MDENSCLCTLITSFIIYNDSYPKIRAGFCTYKDLLDKSGRLIDASIALEYVDHIDSFKFFVKCGGSLPFWKSFVNKNQMHILKEALTLYNKDFDHWTDYDKLISKHADFTYFNVMKICLDCSLMNEAEYFFNLYKDHLSFPEKIKIGIFLDKVGFVKDSINIHSGERLKLSPGYYYEKYESPQMKDLLDKSYPDRYV